MAAKKKLRVGLFFGGTSEERAVSLRTGTTIARYIDSKKYEVIPVEISETGKWLTSSPTINQIGKILSIQKHVSAKMLVPIEADRPGAIDVALLALHGPGGEDGTIQGMLELLGIPYTCSGVLASALAMDKYRTKRIVAAAGVPVLPDRLLTREEYAVNSASVLRGIKGGVVIKPNRMGSSIGITIVKDKSGLKAALESAFRHDTEILLEPFFEGREITVPVLGNRKPQALPVIEILPWKKSDFYDYAAKYEQGGSEHVIPAPLSAAETRQVQSYAVAAHEALGCKGVTRSDFLLNKAGKWTFLEINTIPGMTPTSLVPQSAAAAGISFPDLISRLIELALL